MVTIGRLGRSLGLHLLLASQRLDEGRLRGLESHLSYRIALRTFSASESRAVLGVPDAHQLPPTPGFGVPRRGQRRARAVPGRLRVRRRRPRPPSPGGGRAARAYPFVVGPVPEQAPPARAAPCRRTRGPPSWRRSSPRWRARARPRTGSGCRRCPRHRRWTSCSARSGVALQVAVGLIDRPYLQRRDPLVVDLSGASGHLAVVGGPRAGKSSGLASVVLGLALTHTPDEIGMHVLDFGGGALRPLAGLPHVGTVADRQEVDLVRRTVAELVAALGRRERLFREAGVTSVEAFRARRAAGEFADEPATDLLLVVDGYLTLRAEFDDLEARLLPLAAQGLAYGLHLAVSATRWSELRPALKDLLGARLELRLGEPAESEVDRRRAAAVPARPRPRARPRRRPARARRPPRCRRRRCGRARRARRGGLPRAGVRAGTAPPVAHRRRRPARPAAPASRSASTRTASPGWSWIPPPSRTWCASPTPRAARPRCCGSSLRGSSVGAPRSRRA